MEALNSDAAYGRHMMGGGGLSYWELQRERVCLPECMVDLETGLLVSHHQSHHNIGRGTQWENILPPAEPHIYREPLPNMAGSMGLPFKGCRGQATSHTNIWIQFLHHHVQDMIVILEEGKPPHPRYPECNTFVPWVAQNQRHLATFICTRGGGGVKTAEADRG